MIRSAVPTLPYPGSLGKAALAAVGDDSANPRRAAQDVMRAAMRRVARARTLAYSFEGPERDVELPAVDYAAITPASLGALYGRLLQRIQGRKRIGAYYTPPELVGPILDGALEPFLAAGAPARVIDPACGAGDFLVAAAIRMANRGIDPDTITRSVHGIDIDPIAAEICRFSLWLTLDGRPDPAQLQATIRCADALLEPAPDPACRFDAVIGNPPFINGIEGGSALRMRDMLRRRWPDLTGALDLCSAFVRASADMARPGGRIGLVLPLNTLSNRTLAAFRKDPPNGLRPNVLLIPNTSSLFPSAKVFVCCLVLGPEPICRVRRGDEGPRDIAIAQHNWWSALAPEKTPRRKAGRRLGDSFEVAASMTVSDAYVAARFVRDAPRGPGLKLITTGLIDRDLCRWGTRRCRFLGVMYDKPRLDASTEMPAALLRRISAASRPKVLVAGLTRKLEAFVDQAGNCIGAVSTFSIFDPDDDVERLKKLCRYLHSEKAHALYLSRLGAYRVGGGDITMRKDFLQDLDLDADSEPPLARKPERDSGDVAARIAGTDDFGA